MILHHFNHTQEAPNLHKQKYQHKHISWFFSYFSLLKIQTYFYASVVQFSFLNNYAPGTIYVHFRAWFRRNVIKFYKILEKDVQRLFAIIILCLFSFSATPEGSEFDMRFVYCACCVCHLIDDWSGLNKAEAVKFIRDSLVRLLCVYMQIH